MTPRAKAPHRPVVSFRADPDLHVKLESLRATTAHQTWAEVFAYVFEDPEVVDRIRERVNGG